VDVTVRTVEASPTAVVAGPMDLSKLLACYDTVYAWLRGQSEVEQIGQNIARYGPGTMEVGIEVDRSFESADDVVPSELPAGRIASMVHTTGYGDLQRTYTAIREWCEANGEAMAGVQWEIYGDPDERDHVDVEICFLLSS
jgi:effector-binding domain-containing protein